MNTFLVEERAVGAEEGDGDEAAGVGVRGAHVEGLQPIRGEHTAQSITAHLALRLRVRVVAARHAPRTRAAEPSLRHRGVDRVVLQIMSPEFFRHLCIMYIDKQLT